MISTRFEVYFNISTMICIPHNIEISYWQSILFSFPKISNFDYNKLQDDISTREDKLAISK